jgi:phosphatidylserine/phosphatidylglycerophosphate/cardiolipin synthase-like enzyme
LESSSVVRRFAFLVAFALFAGAGCGGESTTPTAGVPTPGDPLAGEDSGAAGPSPDGGLPVPSDGAAPPPGSLSIIVEPSDKAQALLSAIQGAARSVHVTMYMLSDARFIDALIAQKKAGRDVKVLLNQTFAANTGSNQAAYDQLKAAGVAVAWAPSTFTLTHEKCVIIDATVAWIMTMNLMKTSSSNREFLAVDAQSADVSEAEAIFAADFAGAPITPTGPLLVAPVNASSGLVALLSGATKSVDLEGEELSDSGVVGALVDARQRGLPVRVVLADNPPAPAQSAAVAQLKAASVSVVSVGTPYIHSKAVVVDGARAYVGSENFTTGSLKHNRELGLVTASPAAVAAVAGAIGKDFAAGKAL